MPEYVATTSSIIDNKIEIMKKTLHDTEFGKIGIVCTVHEGNVVKIEEIRETRYMPEVDK